jgi:hypothetical protein
MPAAAQTNRILSVVMLAGIGIAAAVACHRLAQLWTFTIDDAFITARYARNLARGHGAVYNPGEAPVEGTSNFLYVLMLAVAEVSGLVDIITFGKLIGVLAGLAVLVVAFRSATALGADRAIALLAPALLLANSSFVFWTVGGLETNLYTLLLLATLYLLLLAEPRRRNSLCGGVCAALVPLTRFDGLLIVPTLLVGAALLPGRRRSLATALAIFALIVTPWLLWKQQYYGVILPNCGFAKTIVDLDPHRPVETLRNLFASEQRPVLEVFLSLNGPLVVLSLVFGAMCSLPRALPGQVRAVFVTMMLFVCTSLTAYLSVAAWMPGHRYQVPVLPLLSIGATLAVDRLSRVAGGARAVASAAIGIVVLALVWRTHIPLGDELLLYANQYRAWIAADHRATAVWLRAHAAPTAVVGIYDAGVVPYVSERPTIDLGGLNDASVATFVRRGDVPRAVGYVLDRRPAFLVLAPAFPVDRGLFLSDEFKQRYRLVFVSGQSGMNVEYHLHVFERMA